MKNKKHLCIAFLGSLILFKSISHLNTPNITPIYNDSTSRHLSLRHPKIPDHDTPFQATPQKKHTHAKKKKPESPTIQDLRKTHKIPTSNQTIAPKYPELARQKGIECKLIIELIINTKGKVIHTNVIQNTSPGYGFEKEAIQALSKTTFTPIKQKGKKIIAKVHYPISFVLTPY